MRLACSIFPSDTLERVLDQYMAKKPSDPNIAEEFNTYRFADNKEKVIAQLSPEFGSRRRKQGRHWRFEAALINSPAPHPPHLQQPL